jgi:hypothetical protein
MLKFGPRLLAEIRPIKKGVVGFDWLESYWEACYFLIRMPVSISFKERA